MAARKKDPSVRRRRNTATTAATLRRVDSDAPSREEFEAMTVAVLREAIDVANMDRPADQQISKKGAKAELVERLVATDREVPCMPKFVAGYDEEGFALEGDWHPQTTAWWFDAWTSPMAMEWDDSDEHNMLVLALIYNDIWTADTAKARKEAATEYRLQRVDLGLSPYARRRLEWTIETADEARARGEKRRKSDRPAAPKPAAGQPDPRLHLVSSA
ncbi:hypothetical protein EFK50_01105 [Nocardioides marmoriginsengisoli]|uniref:Uncharacterized protein n=1 Tax=Nocardioides marmoriginsengisoli TaxID=661483 RepID=A0A3N0CS02_9ACTN|nr:hypothetical protein [Nocardioides marmoriginsengisoli]RNL66254.1 hypothetical protein EFK50_01105 [Nocardioides marmoriginsengisoli]